MPTLEHFHALESRPRIPMGSWRRRLPWAVVCVGLVVLTCWLYLPALDGELVWDDHWIVTGEAMGGTTLRDCFTKAFLWHHYRPLVGASFIPGRALWGSQPRPYHMENVLLLALSATLVACAVRAAYSRALAGAIAGALWSLHPTQVGTAAWIGGRTDTLGGVWAAGAVWMSVLAARSIGDRRILFQFAAAALFCAGVFTKEQLLAWLPVLPLALVSFDASRGFGRRLDAISMGGLLAVGAAAFVAIGSFTGLARPGRAALTLDERASEAGRIAWHYVRLLIAPNSDLMLTFSAGGLENAGSAPVVAGAFAAIAALVLLAWLWRRDRPSAWFLVLAMSALAPVLGIVPLPFIQIAPYRASLAVLGLAGLAGGVWARVLGPVAGAARAARPGQIAAAFALLAVVAWWGWLSRAGQTAWRTEDALFSGIVAKDPDCVVARYMQARALVAREDNEQAALHLEAVIRLLYRSDPWTRPGAAAAGMRDPRIHRRCVLNQGDSGDPRQYVADLFVMLGFCRIRLSDAPAAQAALRAALELTPESAWAHLGLARVDIEFRLPGSAIDHLAVVLAVDRANPDTYSLLARAYALQGRYPEARDAEAAAERARATYPVDGPADYGLNRASR